MNETIVQRVLPAPLDPNAWETAERIKEVRPWATAQWLRSRRENGTLRFARTGGKTSPCLYRLVDIDSLVASRVVEPTAGPLAGTTVDRERIVSKDVD